jgi:hypothetical protein
MSLLNLAALGTLLATIAGALAGVGAARERGVGWPVVLFALLGLAVGAAIGIAGKKLSYAVLARSCAGTGQRETARNYAFRFLYTLIPVLSMAAAAGATVLLTLGILSFAK